MVFITFTSDLYPWFLVTTYQVPDTMAAKKHVQNVGRISFAAKNHGHGWQILRGLQWPGVPRGGWGWPGHQKRNGYIVGHLIYVDIDSA